MQFAKHLPFTHVLLDLDVTSKKRLFEQIGLLFENENRIARATVFDALLAREKLGSTGLGLGVVTYVGLGAVMTQVQNAVLAQWGLIPYGAMTLMSMSGVTQGVGIILGAMAARFSMLQLSSIARIV